MASLGDYARYGVYGAASQVPNVVLGIPGALGVAPLARAHESVDNWLRTNLGTPDYGSIWNEPGLAATEAAAGFLLGPWGKAAKGINLAVDATPYAYKLLKGAGDVGLGLLGMGAKPTLKNVLAGTTANLAVRQGLESAQEATKPQLAKDAEGYPMLDDEGYPQLAEPSKAGAFALAAAPYVAGTAAILGGAAPASRMIEHLTTPKVPNPANIVGEPLPLPAEPPNVIKPSLTTKLVNEFVNNQTATRRAVEDAEKVGNVAADDADRLRQHVTIGLSQSPRSNVTDEILRTGQLSHGRTMIPLQRLTEQAQAIGPDKLKLYNLAREAENEMDNRKVNSDRGVLHPDTGRPDVNFTGVDNRILEGHIRDGYADPEVARLLHDSKTNLVELLHYARDNGAISADEFARMRQTNPNYLHNIVNKLGEEVADAAKFPLSPRIREPGAGYASGIDALTADFDAYKQTINFVLKNTATREFMETMQQHRANVLAVDPNAKLWVGNIIQQGEKPAEGFEAIPYRDQSGRRLAGEVVPAIAKTMQVGERLTVPLVSALTRVAQAGITGVPGAILASPFAVTSAAMGASAAQGLAPKHVATGLIDKAALWATGGRLSLKADPTLPAVMAYGTAADILAQSLQTTAGVLQRSVDQNGWMTKVFGPEKLQQWSQEAMVRYMQSRLHNSRIQGSSGLGMAHGNVTSKQGDSTLRQINPDYAKTTPTVLPWSNVRSMSDLQSALGHSLLDGKIGPVSVVPAALQRSYGFAEQILDIIGSSGAGAIERLNKGVPGIHGIVRDITGDPAQRPGNRYAAMAVGTIPFGNSILQSSNAWGRGFRKDFNGTLSRMMMQAGVVAGIATLSQLLADEQSVANGEEPTHLRTALMTPSTSTGKVTVSIPGLPYDAGMQLTLDPMVAPFLAMAQHLMLNMLGVNNPSFFGPEGEGIRKNFKQFMQDRAEQMSDGAMNRAVGVTDARGAFPLPPALEFLKREYQDATNPQTQDTGAPGFTMTQLVRDPANTHMANLFETVFTGIGSVAKEEWRTVAYGSKAPGATTKQVAGAVADTYKMGQESGSRLFAPLLQPNRAMPVKDQLSEAVQKMEDGYKRIAAGYTDVTKPGTVGPGRMARTPTAGPGRDVVNPQMVGVLASLHAMDNATKKLRDDRTAKLEDNRSIQADPQMRLHPRQMRGVMNENVKEVQAINAKLYDIYTKHLDTLSQALKRKVDLRVPIDVKRGLDQFPPLR